MNYEDKYNIYIYLIYELHTSSFQYKNAKIF